jgi:hypothetical protein
MKIGKNSWLGKYGGELVASFGEAKLIRQSDGRFELQGGSAEDHTAAQEWISLFMHEAVPRLMQNSNCRN